MQTFVIRLRWGILERRSGSANSKARVRICQQVIDWPVADPLVAPLDFRTTLGAGTAGVLACFVPKSTSGQIAVERLSHYETNIRQLAGGDACGPSTKGSFKNREAPLKAK